MKQTLKKIVTQETIEKLEQFAEGYVCLNQTRLAITIGVHPSTLSAWTTARSFRKVGVRKEGRVVWYNIADVIAWLTPYADKGVKPVIKEATQNNTLLADEIREIKTQLDKIEYTLAILNKTNLSMLTELKAIGKRVAPIRPVIRQDTIMDHLAPDEIKSVREM